MKVFSRFVISWLIWNTVIGISVGILYLRAGKHPFNPEGERFLAVAFEMGLVVVPLCWALCTRFRISIAAPVGFCIGFLTPIALGYVFSRLWENWSWWRRYATSLDAWTAGVSLAIPSALAGIIVGTLQSRSRC
jgi:hypothetical protein